MFISVINENKKRRQLRAGCVYTFLTVFLYLFYHIYIHFSYGQDSIYMQRMFLIPLCLGLLPAMLLLLWKKEQYINRISFNLYNSGLACLICGCLIKGIINISGRYTKVEHLYFASGILFLSISLILLFVFAFLPSLRKFSGD